MGVLRRLDCSGGCSVCSWDQVSSWEVCGFMGWVENGMEKPGSGGRWEERGLWGRTLCCAAGRHGGTRRGCMDLGARGAWGALRDQAENDLG